MNAVIKKLRNNIDKKLFIVFCKINLFPLNKSLDFLKLYVYLN